MPLNMAKKKRGRFKLFIKEGTSKQTVLRGQHVPVNLRRDNTTSFRSADENATAT